MGRTYYFGKPYAREDLTVNTTNVTLSPTVYSPSLNQDPQCAVVTVEAQPIRYTRDGTSPNSGSTPPVGDVHSAGNDPIPLWGLEEIQKFRAIRSGAADATIHVTYFKG